MRTFRCTCGNTLFFENSQCVVCGREAGWCPSCRNVVALLPGETGGYVCGNPGCRAALQKCHNYAVEQVCNRCLAIAPVAAESGNTASQPLCDCCRFNDTIPDLSVPGHRQKWYQLEIAKRRMFYLLDELGLPYGTEADGFWLPLSFDFKADAIPQAGVWRRMGNQERVYTGHANGKITINLREACDAEREKLRVDLQEAHRTLIGHFRHEIGHYYWQLLVQGHFEQSFEAMFGDPANPQYADALERYYQNGPPPDWRGAYISAYATMHPWEDFAETFAAYLDMVSVLDTAYHSNLGGPGAHGEFDAMLDYYCHLGVVLNELNRSMGLIDLVPEIFTDQVSAKMRFVHRLVRQMPVVV
jgi:hypothetical protein